MRPDLKDRAGRMSRTRVCGTDLRPEEMLILSLAVPEPSAHQLEQARRLLDGRIDWQYLVDQCERNHVLSLVYQCLVRHGGAELPEPIRQKCERHVKQNAITNLHLARELASLVEQCRKEGVVLVPFKGALLASVAYGDLSLREFVDLDVLVQKEHLFQVKRLLIDEGYEPVFDMTAEEEEVHVEAQLGYEFVKEDRSVVVELHWAFLRECHAFDLHEEDIWTRLKDVTICQTQMKALSDEDHLLYLCAHGTKHLWERLSWICDIHAFVSSAPGFDWDVFYARADQLGSVRMVNLGLFLARELLDLPLPEEVAANVDADVAARNLAEEVVSRWLFRGSDPDPENYFDVFYFLWRSRERFRDRVPYGLYNLRLITGPRINRVKRLFSRRRRSAPAAPKTERLHPQSAKRSQ